MNLLRAHDYSRAGGTDTRDWLETWALKIVKDGTKELTSSIRSQKLRK
jgi:hypothetical protein